MNILLDTCTFLWVITGDKRLSQEAAELFSSPANVVYLSSISIWEIVLKQTLGKLRLPAPPATFLPRERQRHGIEALPLNEQDIFHLHHLPGIHADPFDILICQAIEHGLTLLTPDATIRQYPVKTMW